MISKQQAQDIAHRYINRPDPYWKDRPEMVITSSESHALGWLFYWTSSRYLQTKKMGDALAGNGPILVSRETGDLEAASTAAPLEKSIAEASERLKTKVEQSSGHVPK